MFYRVIAAASVLLSLTLPASALTIKTMDAPLAAAADRMKNRDFAGARDAALQSGEKGTAAFLAGMACIKMERWEEAATSLAVAAASYPLLADYALYNQGLALSKLGRHDQALPPLYKLIKDYPDSRLFRPALILYADSMAAAGHPKEALETYTTFIERYPSGNDSISALYGSALCRSRLGDPQAAAAGLRTVWLSYPSSTFAGQAAAELQKLAAAGTTVAPYSGAELFKRGSTLYNLGRYREASEAFASLPVGGESEEFASKVRFKTGQALFKSRHYEDAKAVLSPLAQNGNSAAEARFWLAKALDKTGKSEEAFALYLQLADRKGSSLADDALMEAAYLKRFQRKWSEALQLFKRYLASYPNKNSGQVTWEVAWASYQLHDYRAASGYFKSLTERDDTRERALYWLGKSLVAAGDSKGAETTFAKLASEYPFGYYALICNRWCELGVFPSAPRNLTESLALPAGFEREKALIALGLYDEAARELNAKKVKNGTALARLFLEMGNYNGAVHVMAKEKPKRSAADAPQVWGINYPLAFSAEVSNNASANDLPDSLVYAIMRTESTYFPAALSPVGAVGLMQIMPATAERLSKGDASRLTQPALNIKLGSKHLRNLLTLFDKNMTFAIAAYNAGSGNVKRWQKNLGELPSDEFVESIPFGETREYVKKVVTTMQLYQRLYRVQSAPPAPAARPAAQPVAQPAAQPAAQPVAQPAAQQAVQPVGQPAAEEVPAAGGAAESMVIQLPAEVPAAVPAPR